MTHIYCKTSKAILLLGCEQPSKPLVFPSENQDFPGLHLDIEANLPVNDQLLQKACSFVGLGLETNSFHVNQGFVEYLTMKNGENVSLYIATAQIAQSNELVATTMPELLKAMPKNRTRLPYLKAFQLLAGADRGIVKALDLEEVYRHLVKENSKH